MTIIDKFERHKIAEVIEAYLVNGQSHRRIQREILNLPAPARGDGFVVMEILHHFNIRREEKGNLKNNSFNELKYSNDKPFKKALKIYEEVNIIRKEAEKYFVSNQEINKNNNPTESKS